MARLNRIVPYGDRTHESQQQFHDEAVAEAPRATRQREEERSTPTSTAPPLKEQLLHWITDEDVKHIREDFAFNHRSEKVGALRGVNLNRQLKQEVWIKLLSMRGCKDDDPNIDELMKEVIEELEVPTAEKSFKIKKQIRQHPGPVGEIPMHTCFLHLLPKKIRQRIVEKFYLPDAKKGDKSGPDLNTQYQSDLTVWKALGILDEDDPHDDGGLYTGETCLHMAIVEVRNQTCMYICICVCVCVCVCVRSVSNIHSDFPELVMHECPIYVHI
jgi:hypothetical protein